MRHLLSILSLGAATATMPIYGNPNGGAHSRELVLDSIKADSKLGTKLLSQARRLEDGGVDMSWVVDYSIKFQGCHHVSQWNGDAEQDDQVRIQTKRLIRFRLCPTEYCSTSTSSGCSSGYGDYIIDMNEFLDVYFEAVEEQNEYTCQNAYNNCDCQNNGADDYNEDMCYYDCYNAQGVADICMENNPYAEDGQDQQRFQIQDYADCKETNFNNRRLEDAGNDQEDNADQQDAEEDNQEDNQDEQQQQQQENQNQYYEENAPEYYIGPYCAEQGGSIYLGLFYDDTCTTFADNKGGSYTYKTLTGQELPYSSKTIITNDCLSCQQVDNGDNNNNNNNNGYGVSEVCGQIYEEAGKCEKQLYSAGVVAYPNENACNYIKGIKVVRKDGIITQVGSKADKTASIFIGIFVVAFVLLAAYVYYLKTKLDRVSINLAE
mmetsp:Transcript_8436/g.20292  ORF Transcript_8436/g.20292 Transcript_8436/m.20292 type:complete len:434 (+) Transcript_8436:101-1402(+)